jgi:hypothetical protein
MIAFSGRWNGQGDDRIDWRDRRQSRVCILRRGARQDDNRCQMHDAAKKRAA